MYGKQRIATFILGVALCVSMLAPLLLARKLSGTRVTPKLSLKKRAVADAAPSHQVSVVASTEFHQAESGHGHGYHKGHGLGHHKEHNGHNFHKEGHKGDSGFKHHKSHRGAKHGHHTHHGKKSHHHDGGKHHKGKHHKSRHHGDSHSGKGGKKGHKFGVESHSKKYGKGGGYENFHEKAEEGKTNKFYDDKDSYDWNQKWDTYSEYVKGTKSKGEKGKSHKGGKHFDKYGKKGHYKKGSYHDKEGGHKSGHKHREHHGHQSKYGKKGGTKKKHGSKKHHGHHGDHGYHGSHGHDHHGLHGLHSHHGPHGLHSHHGHHGFHDHHGDYSHRNPQVHKTDNDYKQGHADQGHYLKSQDHHGDHNYLRGKTNPSSPRDQKVHHEQETPKRGKYSDKKLHHQHPSLHGKDQGRHYVENQYHRNHPREQDAGEYHVTHTNSQFTEKPPLKSSQPEQHSFRLFTFIPILPNQESKYHKKMQKSGSDNSEVSAKLSNFVFSKDDASARPFQINFEDFGEFMDVQNLL